MTDAQFQSLRTALLLIAAGLFANAAAQLVPPAIAAERVEARIENAIDVDELSITDFRDELVIGDIKGDIEVKLDGSGGSSSFPLYVKIVP